MVILFILEKQNSTDFRIKILRLITSFVNPDGPDLTKLVLILWILIVICRKLPVIHDFLAWLRIGSNTVQWVSIGFEAKM